MRMLHSIMYKALPTQGYIKPYKGNKEAFMNSGLQKSENIYIEVGNYYDHVDTEHGLLEHVYQYRISDGVVSDETMDMDLIPIRDISVLIGTDTQREKEYTEVHVGDTINNTPEP